jgi:hypothetical protein
MTLAAYLVMIASVLLVYFPVFAVGNVEKMILQELTLIHPRFVSLQKRYQLVLAIVFVPLAILAIYIFTNQERFGEQAHLLFVPFVCAFSLANGILAFSTGIYPLWIGKNRIRYWYDESHKKSWVAEVQIGLAILLIGVSLFLYFV